MMQKLTHGGAKAAASTAAMPSTTATTKLGNMLASKSGKIPRTAGRAAASAGLNTTSKYEQSPNHG